LGGEELGVEVRDVVAVRKRVRFEEEAFAREGRLAEVERACVEVA
jgi:hypothetical protein